MREGNLRPRSWVIDLAVAAAALYLLPAQLAPRRFPTDDSFFYLQVACNVVAGHGSTFNTVTLPVSAPARNSLW